MKNVQDIYPATPMQELMLLHSLGQRHADRLLSQFGFEIPGPVDAQALESAWNAVVARHPMLRTAFVTRKVPAPLQVVRQAVRVPFTVLDWRGESDCDARFDALRAEDRAAGIDTQRAPLMRVTLVRTAGDIWRLLWTSHHLLMDRWCLAPLFDDLDVAYRAALDGGAPELAAAPSFRQYVDWLSTQDHAAATRYWRDELRGFATPTPLASEQPDGARVTAQHYTLGAETFDQLQRAARRFAVSPATLMQGALALVIAEKHGLGDVVFGTAAAARPPAIANVEKMIGSFVNNLPVRVRCRRQRSIREWLRDIAERSFSRSDAEYLSPLAIAELAPLPDNTALFDTLLVWLAPTRSRLPLAMTSLWDDMATAYPLTISVAETPDDLTLHLHQYADDPEYGAKLLDALRDALLRLASAADDALVASVLSGHVADAPDSHVHADGATTTLPTDTQAPTELAGRFQIPEPLVRQLVAHQFALALDREDVPADDDFFALGGNSLKAAQLHAQICQGTRKTVPLLALFQTPTVNGIVQTLTQQTWPEKPDRILSLRDSGTGTPLICVASPEVNTLGYFVLSRRLPPQQSMYVLQVPPVSDRPQPIDPGMIEALADEYVTALRERQPDGPYQLLGMCGGAHLALAMARRLTADGQRVAFFGVVNTWSLYSVSWVYYLHRARRVAAYYRRRLREMLPGEAPPPEVTTTQYVPQEGPATEDVGLGNPWIRDVGFAHRWPNPESLPVRAHVFRIERQQYWRIRDVSLGWGRFFDDSSVVHLPGRYHDNLMREPYVADLADALAPRLIDAADTADPADAQQIQDQPQDVLEHT